MLENNNEEFNQINDFTNFTFYDLLAMPYDLIEKITEFMHVNNLTNSSPGIYIIKNENITDGIYDQVDSIVKSRIPSLSFIFYVQRKEEIENEIYLWVRIEGGNKDYFPLTYSPDEDFNAIGDKAQNFNELISLIKEAEDKLIESGHSSIEERIKIIRGIYYGTPWSMDRSQSYGSDMRNTGFKTYLCDPNTPVDPRSIISSTLFNKMKNSAEVVDGNKGVDFGHIIIGLESRLSFCSSKMNIQFHEITGLEICTWIGDLGGGSGMLANRRVGNPAIRAKTIFNNSQSDFGGWINMEGDIAAYLVARNKSKTESIPTVFLTNHDYLADALKDYLIPQPPKVFDWSIRSRLFLEMLGGKFNGDILVNKTKLIEEIADDIEDFSENYIVLKSFNDNSINLYKTSKYFKPCSVEVADIFVNALNNMIGINDKFNINNLDPNPKPATEPYTKYKFKNSVEDLYDKLERYLK